MKIILSLLCVAVVICRSLTLTTASSEELTLSNVQHPALSNRAQPPQQQLWLIRDHLRQGDLLLKEQLQERYQSLREQLKDGNERLKEQLVDGDARLKEQLRDTNAKLKEELTEEEKYIKDQLTRGQVRVKEELTEGAAERTEKLQEQQEMIETMKTLLRNWTKKNDVTIAQLTEEMSDVKTQLQTTKGILDTTKDKLRNTQSELRSTQETLQTTQDNLQTTQNTLQSTRDDLRTSRRDIQEAKAELQLTKEQQKTVHQKISGLERLSIQDQVRSSGEQDYFGESTGSTFIRWGRQSCPGNTSLIYDGIVGGKHYTHKGSGTNALCLPLTPEYDDVVSDPANYGYVYGAEYQDIPVHHDHDVPCSVCRAPQSTTIMVPATHTCPVGWAPQYTGHLVSAYHDHFATEFVCLDGNPEHDSSGAASHDGFLFYHVTSQCGSLPCPPYVGGKVITCVVCSN